MVDGDGNKRPLPLFRCKDNPRLFSAMQKNKTNFVAEDQRVMNLCFPFQKTFKIIGDFFFLPCYQILKYIFSTHHLL